MGYGICPPLKEALLRLQTGPALQGGHNYLEKTNMCDGEGVQVVERGLELRKGSHVENMSIACKALCVVG